MSAVPPSIGVLVVLCLILASSPSADSLRPGSYHHFPPDRQGAGTSLKRTLFDLIFKRLLDLQAKQEQERVESKEASEESSDPLSGVTRYVGVGYNLLRGSPDGDFDRGGIDPGIHRNLVVFEFTYNEGKTAYMNGPMSVPDQVNFQPSSSCSQNTKRTIYSGAKSYQKSLDFGLNAGGTYNNDILRSSIYNCADPGSGLVGSSTARTDLPPSVTKIVLLYSVLSSK